MWSSRNENHHFQVWSHSSLPEKGSLQGKGETLPPSGSYSFHSWVMEKKKELEIDNRIRSAAATVLQSLYRHGTAVMNQIWGKAPCLPVNLHAYPDHKLWVVNERIKSLVLASKKLTSKKVLSWFIPLCYGLHLNGNFFWKLDAHEAQLMRLDAIVYSYWIEKPTCHGILHTRTRNGLALQLDQDTQWGFHLHTDSFLATTLKRSSCIFSASISDNELVYTNWHSAAHCWKTLWSTGYYGHLVNDFTKANNTPSYSHETVTMTRAHIFLPSICNQ